MDGDRLLPDAGRGHLAPTVGVWHYPPGGAKKSILSFKKFGPDVEVFIRRGGRFQRVVKAPARGGRRMPHFPGGRMAAGVLVLLLGLAGSAGGAPLPGWREAAPQGPLTLWLAVSPESPGPETRRLVEAVRFLAAWLEETDRVGVVAISGGLRPVLPALPLTAVRRQALLQKVASTACPAPPGATPELPAGGEEGARGEGGYLVLLSAQARLKPLEEAALNAARRAGLTPLWLNCVSRGNAGLLASEIRTFAPSSPQGWPEACLELVTHLKAPEMVPPQAQGFFLDSTVVRARWYLPLATGKPRPVLITPDGRVLAAGRPSPEVTWQSGEGFLLAEVRRPLPGWWRVSGGDAQRQRCLVETRAPLRVWLPEGSLRAHLRPWVAAGWWPSEDSAELPGPISVALEWQRPDGTWQQMELGAPPRSAMPDLPAGVRLGLLPEALAPGICRLRVSAAGPEGYRARQVEFMVRPAGGLSHEGDGRLRLPVEEDPPGGWHGWLSLSSPDSGWAGRFVQVSLRQGWLGRLSGLPPGTYAFAAELRAMGTPGLPPVLRPTPVTLSLSGAGSLPAMAPAASPAGLRGKLSRLTGLRPAPPRPSPLRRLALGLAGLGLAGGVGLLVLLAILMRRTSDPSDPEQNLWDHGPGLLAGEQLQAVLAERARLAARVEELEQTLGQLLKEKEGLQQELESRLQAIQEKARLAEQWQSEAVKAQEEARLIQEEYTALYARSHRDRRALRQS